MQRARLIFQDGAELTVAVAPGQTLLEGALAADAPVRYDCCSGSCGSCVVQCLAGESVVDVTGKMPVNADELAEGLRPACLTRIKTDATFELPYSLHDAPSLPSKHSAQIVELRRGAPSVALLKLQLDRAEDFVFQPGQYVRLAAPGVGEARAYSIASTATDLPLLELMIRLVPNGTMSRWLQETAKVGDRVKLQAPLGSFGLDDRATRHVFVAGGTGLAPVLSMVRSLRGRGQPALLCFGCTRRQELFYEQELAALAASMPELEVRIAVMEGADIDLHSGTAVSLLRREDFDAATVCYLCGPPLMVDAARKALSAHGVATKAIRAERFQPGG
ncbi:2Fe-2S iron-sulfur cluster binding domain-containing protein [Steroidobacter sp.]|uniref:2Fe-2S iron-sulfur cluster binding domain-containing protein n=1 Tax=Steroidobacter sp. TaxID=1978227 RepID=UPI001A3D02B6|nr:2Fe-2S iron-sulfur cluster binding domain-containing protein [Steroidobacter sp.]MBL8269395.1 2Fe-2S iron-sulfur cluster binding domain-containing protein [Steroidobacter sp.]